MHSVQEEDPLLKRDSLNPRKWKRHLFFQCTGIWLFQIAFMVGAAVLIHYQYHSLPTPVSMDFNTTFSEERARVHLNYLVNTIGPRPIGSKINRNETFNYILEELGKLKEMSDYQGSQRLSFSVDNHIGNFRDDYWNSLGNIVAVIKGSQNSSEAFLISAHYDTVCLSPGAFDDTSGVVVLLDLIYVLIHQEPAKNDLIILFNNGEESGLLGSEDFVLYDNSWKRIVGFINCDSTPGYKPIMFQTTGSWLDFLFQKFPRPLGTVAGQDIFDLGLVSSITDFSVYSGQRMENSTKVPGLDFAYFEFRQTYHTIRDTQIPIGALQFHGDNLLVALNTVLNLDSLSTQLNNDLEKHVYFDFLNLFGVVYSLQLSTILHSTVAALYLISLIFIMFFHRRWYVTRSKLSARSHPIAGAFKTFMRIFVSFILGIAFSYAIGYILSLYNPFFYYSSLIIAVATFSFATLAGICITLWLFYLLDRRTQAIYEAPFPYSYSSIWGVSIFWCVLMIATAPLSAYFGSTYIFFYPCAFSWISLLLHHLFYYIMQDNDPDDIDYTSANVSNFTALFEEDEPKELKISPAHYIFHVVTYIITSFPPFILVYYTLYLFTTLMVASMPSSITAPVFSVIVALGFISFYPLSTRANSYGSFSIIFLIGTIACIIAASTLVPYTNQPFSSYVQQRASNTSSEVIMFSRLPHLESALEKMDFTKEKLDCYKSVGYYVCTYGDAERPIVEPLKYIKSSTNTTNTTTISVSFSNPGSFVADIYISTSNQVLNSIYVDNHLIAENKENNLFQYFFSKEEWTLNITTQLNSQEEINLNIVSHYDMKEYSPEIMKLINELPDWATFIGSGTGLINVETEITI